MTMEDIFIPVEGGRISVQIVQQIQDAIRSKRLKPGDRLPPERDLAGRFGVSRVTVRDALRSLEVLGLIQVRVGAAGGAFVTSPGAEIVGEGLTNLMLLSSLEHGEIAEARLVIELGSVALATARATDDDILMLRSMMRDARSALDEGTYERSMSLRFHLSVAEIARNKAITLFTDSFRGPLSMHAIRKREPRLASFQHTVEEHEGIVKAIEQRDAKEAQRRMADHLMRGTKLPDDAIRALLGSPA
ncbi:MAG: FadR/GntR family transcriptional regulator [Micromonosporaceae bacterium]